jgi:ATP-dependent Clp protease protease subunit
MNLGPRALGPGHMNLAEDGPDDEARLYVYGDIGGWYEDSVSAHDTVRALAVLNVKTLHAHINSPGGSVFEGVSIYNELARMEDRGTRVVVHIDGIAASIASVIAMAGDEIRIGEGANFMIHKPWTMIAGDADDLIKEAGVLNTLQTGLVDIYEQRTGAARADIEAWVNDETWFTAKDAVEHGFADLLVEGKKKGGKKNLLTHARSALLPLFRNTPTDLLAANDGVPGIRTFEALLRDVEGLSASKAKQFAAMARVAFQAEHRDDAKPNVPAPADAEPPAPAHRDDGLSELQRLAQLFQSSATA